MNLELTTLSEKLAANIYYCTVSAGQESRHSLVGLISLWLTTLDVA